jgi:hypothetical protein
MRQYRFRRWLRNWLNNYDSAEPEQSKLSVGRSLGDHRDTMHFNICRATGGYIVEYNNYDRKRDEHTRNLHIITEDQDLGESISKIVTIEMLRN